MSQSIYNSDNYPLFDIYNNQYQTLIQETYHPSGMERRLNPNLLTSHPKVDPTSMKKTHPSKYQQHAFSTQLYQKLKANKRKQQFERLQKLQQIQIMKKNKSHSLPSPTSPTSPTRTCHAFSTQLYSKLKSSTLSL